MKTFALTALAFAALASASFTQSSSATCKAGERPACLQECPTAQKVSSLLGKWKAAADQPEMTSEARQEASAKLASVAAQCPVGSRLGETMAAVKDALAFVSASEAACAESCPLEKMDASSPAVAKAKELKAARIHMIASLNELAGYTAGTCAASCASKAGAEACKSSAKTSVAAECSTAAASCPIRIASRIGAAKASFARARKEVAALTPEARGAIAKGIGEMTQLNPALPLVPESVLALAEGLSGLKQIHAQMGEFAEANPEMFADLPKEAHITFMVETSLIDEASQLLATVTETMAAMQAEGGQKTALH